MTNDRRLADACRSLHNGRRADMDDIVRAFEKVHEHRTALTAWDRARRHRRRKGPE